MNVNYIKLPDDTTMVTDDKGEVKKIRETSKKQMIIKNKLEMIEKSIQDTKISVEEKRKNYVFANKMLKSQPIILSIYTILCAGLTYLLNPFDLSLLTEGAMIGFITEFTFFCIPVSLHYGIFEYENKKELNSLERKLVKAEEIKKEYEIELEKENKYISSFIKKESDLVNKKFSLRQYNQIEQSIIDKQLEDAYLDKDVNILKLKRKH